jgi:hypothetical protein
VPTYAAALAFLRGTVYDHIEPSNSTPEVTHASTTETETRDRA